MAVSKEKSTETEPVGMNSMPIWLRALLLVLLTVICYSPVLHQDFVHWDDKGHVTGNPYLQHITSANLLHFWQHPYEHLYIPISYMAFALLASIARMPHHDASVTVIDTLLNPHVFHAANLILHCANTLIVYALLRRFIPNKAEADRFGRMDVALVGAIVFALHPLQVESVAWISELRGQLASLFCVLSMYGYVGAVQQSEARPWSRPVYWLALVSTVLGLLCKPSIVTVGLVLLIIDRWMLGRSWRAAVTSTAPWLILAVPFTLLTSHAQPVDVEGAGAIWQRPFIAGDALAFYLSKLFYPEPLAIEYGRRPDVVLAHGTCYLTTAVTLVIVGIVFALRKGRPWLVAGALIPIAFLLPVLGLVPFAYQNYSTVADRYMYLAMLGPAIIVGQLFRNASSTTKKGYGLVIAFMFVVSMCSYMTRTQVRYWDNSLTLFKHAVAVNPNSYGLRTNYGVSLDDRGRYDDAIAQYREAQRILPDFPDGYQDMGVSLQSEGKLDEAMAAFRKAVEIAPDYPLGHAAIGLMLLRQNKPADALVELQLSAQLAPGDSQNRAHLAAALQQLGRTDEARDQYNQALGVDPANISALTGLSSLDLAAGHLDAAESDSRRALEYAPKDPKTHATLADILQKKGDVDGAIAEFRQAVALDPKVDALHFALGSALFGNHDVTDAIPELEEAVRLNPSEYHHDQLGVAYATVGNMTSARQEFEAAIRVNPHYAPAQKHIGMLSR